MLLPYPVSMLRVGLLRTNYPCGQNLLVTMKVSLVSIFVRCFVKLLPAVEFIATNWSRYVARFNEKFSFIRYNIHWMYVLFKIRWTVGKVL